MDISPETLKENAWIPLILKKDSLLGSFTTDKTMD
jgi:hypothetical protein